MKTFTKNKGILGIAAVLILVMFVYNSFFRSEELSIPSELQASNIGDDLIKTHEALQKVTLDQNFFASQGYLSLIDFSIAILPQTIGRPNPFNIIGRD